jgi:hypothetical protein
MRTLALILLNLTLWSLPAQAQLWSNVLDPARAIDWTTKGAGPIPTRTTICSTFNPGATSTQINSAIASCPAGQVVKLNAGTYTLTTGLVFSGKDNVTLRGAGPDATFLEFTAINGCGGKAGMVCVINGSTHYPGSQGNTVNWTSGYAKGTTAIVLSATTNLQVGSTMVLDQLNDVGTADPGNDIWVCVGTPTCTQSGGSGSVQREQVQFVTVTSISGGACPCTIGISPGIYMPNWRSARSPQAWWVSNDPYVTGVGLEDFSIKYQSGVIGPFNISFFNAKNSWVKNVRSIKPEQKHVNLFVSHHITVRDSYFFSTTNSVNDSYAVDLYWAGDNLIENNIAQRVAVPWMVETNAPGSVFGYNYSINNLFDSGNTATQWMQAAAHDHGNGSSFVLFESNDGNGTVRENYFGMVHFFTDFRNRWAGWEPSGVMQNQSVAVMNQALARFHNYIGNVLGTDSFHTTYQTIAGGSTTNCTHSIYAIGLGSNCANGGSGPFPPNDANTLPSLMRWGNYDTVNDTSRFVAGEVPSGISNYSNPVPASNNLPPSFYLSSKPAWFGSVTWPAIGPDVSGGSEPNVGGHNAMIPARRCFENVMGGTFSDTVARTFNANLCYATGGGDITPPNAPTNLTVQ